MAEPFGKQRPAGARVLARVLGTHAKSGAIAEIEELLGAEQRVSDLATGRVDEVATRYGVDLDRQLLPARRSLYRRFLAHCLVDCALSGEESDDLAHLQRLLRLEGADVRQIHDAVARETYGAAVAQVLADQRIDPDERAFLERLGTDLSLSAEAAEELYRKGSEESRSRYLPRTQAHDSVLVASKSLELDLEGKSETSLEDAIRSALDEAARAAPGIRSAEGRGIHTEVRDGRVTRWLVSLRAATRERNS